MAFFDDIATQGTTPSTSTPAASTIPNQPTVTGSGFFGSVKPQNSVSSSSKGSSFFDGVAPSKNSESSSTPSYFYKQFPSGATLGASDQKDTSGRPLVGYRNPGDTATSTDSTRVDTTFDPFTPQALTHEQYYNPRAQGLREQYHDVFGIKANEELDHAMALSLGGSNQPSNLRPLPTAENQAAGKFEEQLAESVKSGKLSYADAQIEEAKNKGIPVPWMPPEFAPKQGEDPWTKFKQYLKSAFGVKTAQAQTTDLSSPETLGKESSRLDETAKGIQARADKLASLKESIDGKDEAAVKKYNDEVDQLNNEVNGYKSDAQKFNKAVDDYNIKNPISGQTIGPKTGDTVPYKPSLVENLEKTPGLGHVIKIGENIIHASDEIVHDATDAIMGVIAAWSPKSTDSLTSKISASIAGGLRAGGDVAFSLPSLILGGVKDVPVLGPLAQGAATLFGNIGEVGSEGAVATVNKLPIPDTYKKDLEPLAKEAGSLGAQILAGDFATGFKGSEATLSKLNSLKSQMRDILISGVKEAQQLDAWRTLGSPKNAAELTTNYRKLALQFHPDIAGGSVESMNKLNRARDLLIDRQTGKANLPSTGAIARSKLAGALNLKPKVEMTDLNLKKLPGYAFKYPKRFSAGLSIEPVEPVGFGEKPKESSPDLNKIHQESSQFVENNKEALVQKYTQEHGNVFSVDKMKDFIPGHTENPTLSEAFHKPAANLVGEMIDTHLQSESNNGKDVIFTGGATGAGKSTAIESLAEGKGIDGLSRFADAHAVIDGTFADNNRSRDQVRLALNSGHPVEIRYVDNTPERILQNVIDRAKSGGRTIPIETIYNSLLKSRRNVLRTNGTFGDNPDFNVSVIDNRGSVPKIIDNGVDYLKNNPYSEKDIAQAKDTAYAKVEELYHEGKISKPIYEGLIRRKESQAPTGDFGADGEEYPGQREERPSSSVAEAGKTPEIYSKFLNSDPSVEEELAREAEELNVINQSHAIALSVLEEDAMGLEFRREALENNPARQLSKYVSKSGDSAGKLPEVTGGEEATSEFAKRGDDIVTELGFPDAEAAREGWQKYKEQKDKYMSDMKALQDRKRVLFEKFREDMEKYGGRTSHPAGRYDIGITKANEGIVPPLVRGGLHAPEMDLTTFKDLGAARLGRDTMERNIEKSAGPYGEELKHFIIDPVRDNEVERIHYVDDIRKDLRKKLDDWGITRKSDEADLIQRYGEGYLSIEQLKSATPKWKEVMSAADYFRKLYDHLIDDWNLKRAKFGYSAVPKRQDYFRHFNDINQFTNTFGFLRSESQLPTEIAGMSFAFKPGKPFSTAELHRIGNMTSYDALGGMDNYLDSVSKQMFHIDSVQRGRALEKYIRKVAKENRGLKLPNFVQNVQEWTNLVSGKAAMLDRAIESTVGRPVMKFMKGLANLVGRNIIVGNVSVAMTHLVSLPLNLATVDKVPFVKGLFGTLVSPLKAEPITMIDGVESSFLVRRFPEKYIKPTEFDTLQETLSWLFTLVDMFKSKVTVESKYYEGLSNGLSKPEAMRQADIYGGRIVGDYSVGNRPNLMSAHITKLFAQFQLGVNDGLSVLMHDIPEWEKGNKWKIGYRLVAFAVFSYLFNQLYAQIRGSGKGLDPIGAGLTLMGMTDESEGQDFLTRLKMAGMEVAGELPFTSIGFGTFPLATAVAQPLQQMITGPNRAAAAKTLAADLISPVGGGGQAKKTIEGVKALATGETTTARGEKNANVEPSISNILKGVIFGPSALNAASGANSETKNLISMLNAGNGQASLLAEKTYSDLKNDPQASSKFEELYKNNPALAKMVEKVATEEKEGITLNERLIQKLGVSNGDRAKYIADKLNGLPDQKSKADLWQRYTNLKIISPQVANQLAPLIAK